MDIGRCGACGNIGQVSDPELLDLYAGFDLADDDIQKFLPRLRSSHNDEKSPVLDWTQIGEKIRQRITQDMLEMTAGPELQ